MRKTLIKDSFESFISDPGIGLTHPKKEKITLDDIFVFPNLRHPSEGEISSKELLKINKGGNKVIISGPQDSGKTTLVKVLVDNYLKSGLYPIFVDIENYDLSNSQELIEILYRVYELSYDEDCYNKIKSQSKKEKAVFIDNFSKLNCSSMVIEDILIELCNLFDNVILCEQKPAIDYGLQSISLETVSEYQHYELLEFNDDLQLELIQKWNSICIDHGSDTENIKLKIDKTRNFIDTVIGHNLVPSYPIYLLTILQMDNQGEDLSASGSSFSHYYEYLIIKSLQKYTGKESIYKYFELLSRFSFYMFEKEKRKISDDELRSIFNKTLHKSLKYNDVLENMIKSEILVQEKMHYNFKYKYAYHYFVAKYLSDNIHSKRIKHIIKELCSELGNDDAANIVLFITHLTDDSFMMDELSVRAKSIFSDIDDLSTIEDSSEIDELIEELSQLGTKDRKLRESVSEYSSPKGKIIQVDFQKKKSLNAANNFIRIVRQILNK